LKIDKAIKELSEYNGETFETRFVTFSKALQLGIEALKEIERIRSHKDFDATIYLPGETI